MRFRSDLRRHTAELRPGDPVAIWKSGKEAQAASTPNLDPKVLSAGRAPSDETNLAQAGPLVRHNSIPDAANKPPQFVILSLTRTEGSECTLYLSDVARKDCAQRPPDGDTIEGNDELTVNTTANGTTKYEIVVADPDLLVGPRE